MRKIIVSIVLWSMIFLTGCVSKSGITNGQKKSNESLPTIRYKSDNNSSFGQMSAVYDNHLYYCDQKEEGAGIYKQNLSTNQEKLIIEVESVRKIQITEEGIYYIGRTPQNDIKATYPSGKWNTYQLFFHEGHQQEEREAQLMADFVFAWDFIVTPTGIFLVTVENDIPTGSISLYKYFIEKRNPICWNEVNTVAGRVAENINVSEFRGLIFGSMFPINKDNEELTIRMTTVYYEEVDGIVYRSSDRIHGEEYIPYLFLTKYNDSYICNENNNIFLIDEAKIKKRVTIEQINRVNFGFKQGNQMYLVGSLENQESIHVLDMDTFEVEYLKELDENEKVVAMTDKWFVCATPNEIILRDAKKGEILDSKPWNKKINWDKNTIEVTGNYIFAYDYKNGINIQERHSLMW